MLEHLPANVLVGRFGETVVADWGLAVELSPTVDDSGKPPVAAVESGAPDLTTAGTVLGTP